METERLAWKPNIDGRDKPAYLAIADAIAADIAAGRLAPRQRLPPQRVLAEQLGIDFTTVSRGYTEARHRGLVDARVGRGTFVSVTAPRPSPERAPAAAARFVDMTMNQPPLPEASGIIERLREGLAAVAAGIGLHELLRYPEADDQAESRAAGSLWLRQRLPEAPPERILVCPGTQSALLALLTALARPGDTVCAEALTYPGFKAIATQLGLRLVGVPMDDDGLNPDALASALAEHRPKALYCMPTLHNPTTATMSPERRAAVVRIARAHGVPILEDDIYGPLAAAAPPPLAVLAPEGVYYIGGLAKCLSPALRIAYVLAPDARLALRLNAALRSTALIASPLTAAVARRWILDGSARAVLEAIRDEATVRNALARTCLPSGSFVTSPEAFHLWLRLPEVWSRGEFTAAIRVRGIAAVASDAFALSQSAPEALRICLGAPIDREETRRVLGILAETLDQFPAGTAAVI